MNRREFMLASCTAIVSLSAGCKKDARCKHCGMRIDPSSAWRAELVGADGSVTAFDTPRCALTSWRTGTTPARSIRVQDYYDRETRDGKEVRFVVGGDVVGPMGPDIVPVDPARASKFVQDHGAERALLLDEVTPQVLSSIGSK
jgi:nitrous oxide reductase accessory protein NosL